MSSPLKWGLKSMPAARSFSLTSYQSLPRIQRSRPGQRPIGSSEEGSEEDMQIKAQEALEKAARPVHMLDSKAEEEGVSISYETCIHVILERLQPITQYQACHDSLEVFLTGFAFPKSAKGRAREATVWLFVSAYDWFTRAMSIAAETNRTLSPEMLKAAKLWLESGQIVEAYVQEKTPETPEWPEVGAAILNCCIVSWPALREEIYPEDIDYLEKDGLLSEEVEKQHSATTKPETMAHAEHATEPQSSNNPHSAATRLANDSKTTKTS
ncbi:hypothetical protein BU17DRAFT_98489 [Hysterangium stoloniferum]|nr:hypothetical protein BU17DRAFT_98489 [Hysterangium stoloniferum]